MADTADLNRAAPSRATAAQESESTGTPWAPGPAGIALAEEPDRLQRLARRNLWMHFTRMGAYDEDHAVPVIVRGEGCYVYDEHGKRYLDGLSALYCVNAGHGRAELGEAAAAQARQLGFYTNWSYAHPPAIELAKRIADLAPGNLNRVFFTSGGSEAVESAWKLAKAYHRARDRGGDRIRGRRHGRRGDPRAGPERRRVLHAAGGLLPARPRDLRSLRRAADLGRGDLLVGADRLLVRQRALRLPAGHDHDREGDQLRVRAARGGDRWRPHRRALHGGQGLLRPRLHLRRPPGRVRGRP